MIKINSFITKCFLFSFPLSLCTIQAQATNEIKTTHNSMKQHTLSDEELLNAQTRIFNLIKSNELKLIAIQENRIPLVKKWQQFLQLILPIQLEIIKTYGLEGNQLGLSIFNKQYMERSLENPTLSQLNKQKWLFLFEKTFGATEFKQLSLKETQDLVEDIASAMTSDYFLNQIDDAMNSLNEDVSMIQKREHLLTILFPLHMSVMERHGFKGELGYIQAQKAIMDYYHDPKISQDSSHAQSVIFKRAKLL